MFVDGLQKTAAGIPVPAAPRAPAPAAAPRAPVAPAYKPPTAPAWNPSMKQFPRKAPAESQASIDAETNREMGIRNR
jgi:hypothetical protein